MKIFLNIQSNFNWFLRYYTLLVDWQNIEKLKIIDVNKWSSNIGNIQSSRLVNLIYSKYLYLWKIFSQWELGARSKNTIYNYFLKDLI